MDEKNRTVYCPKCEQASKGGPINTNQEAKLRKHSKFCFLLFLSKNNFSDKKRLLVNSQVALTLLFYLIIFFRIYCNILPHKAIFFAIFAILKRPFYFNRFHNSPPEFKLRTVFL